MTGISEILVLILLILCILIVPRMLNPAPAPGNKKSRQSSRRLNMKLRAAIVLSLTVIVVSGLWIKPWQGEVVLFIALGILPVALCWALVWIFSARKK